jgi:transcriptional regulator with XRE-family HTH domain
MTTFGPLIKALRKSADLTLEVVAKKIGSHKGYVSGMENEKCNPPSVGVVRRIFKLYAPELAKAGVSATEEDLVELAWVSKSPTFIRKRLFDRIATNPLAAATVKPPPPAIAPADPAREAS